MFEMNDACENCSEVTMAALCRELLEETETQENIEQGVVSVALIENKLCTSKSSVVKKLKKAGLDLLAIAGENPKKSLTPSESINYSIGSKKDPTKAVPSN